MSNGNSWRTNTWKLYWVSDVLDDYNCFVISKTKTRASIFYRKNVNSHGEFLIKESHVKVDFVCEIQNITNADGFLGDIEISLEELENMNFTILKIPDGESLAYNMIRDGKVYDQCIEINFPFMTTPYEELNNTFKLLYNLKNSGFIDDVKSDIYDSNSVNDTNYVLKDFFCFFDDKAYSNTDVLSSEMEFCWGSYEAMIKRRLKIKKETGYGGIVFNIKALELFEVFDNYYYEDGEDDE